MEIFFLLLFFSLLYPCNAYEDYSGYQLLSIVPQTESQRDALTALKHHAFLANGTNELSARLVQFWNDHAAINYQSQLLVAPQAKRELADYLSTYELEFTVSSKDVGKMLEANSKEIEKRKRKFDAFLADSEHVSNKSASYDLYNYHCYQEEVRYLAALAVENPGFVKYMSLGPTHEKRALSTLKIGYPSEGNTTKPALLLFAHIHAREWMTSPIAMNFISQLVNNKSHAQLLKEVDFYVLPLANPDGYEYSRTDDPLWRKNRSPPTGPEGCYGVDPNRNFGYQWDIPERDTDPCSEAYGGQQPNSELEVQAISRFMSEHNATIKLSISFHSAAGLLLHPFHYKKKTYPNDIEDLRTLGRKAQKAVQDAGGPLLEMGNSGDLLHYVANGNTDDWAKHVGIKYVYTIELPGDSFQPPPSEIKPTVKVILPALFVFAEQVQKMAV